jgi:triphosphatase
VNATLAAKAEIMARTISTHTRQDAPARATTAAAKKACLRGKKFQGRSSLYKASPARVPPASKSASVTLKAGATVDEAIFVIASSCLAHWQANLPAALTQKDAEGTHQIRVALRRFRSALSAFKKYIPEAQRIWLNAEAKWLLSQLGPARDLDVFIQELSKPLAEKVSDNAALAQLMRSARSAQGKAHTAAARALKGTRTARFTARLEAWLVGHGWRAVGDEKTHDSRAVSAADFSARFLNKRLRNLHDDYDDIENLTVDERHELRIDVKKIRYGVEFFQAVLPAKRAARLNEILKDLQDNLGHLNDLSVAERTVATLVNGVPAGAERRHVASGGSAVSAWHKHAAAQAEPKTVKLWRKLTRVPAF